MNTRSLLDVVIFTILSPLIVLFILWVIVFSAGMELLGIRDKAAQ